MLIYWSRTGILSSSTSLESVGQLVDVALVVALEEGYRETDGSEMEKADKVYDSG